MDMSGAIEALGALAQETRLRGFRLLVEAAPEGLPAGELARRLAFPPIRCRATWPFWCGPGWRRSGAKAA